MRYRNTVTRFVMLLVLLIVTLSVSVLPGAAKGDMPSDQGCSPGYWKQSRHLDSWVGYGGVHDFDLVFGVTTGNYMTLQDALRARGGGENALARHAVAALLNAANPGVAYPYSEAEIIAWVKGAYAPGGDLEAVKDLLADANEAGCPLD
jgi:hypothetical protein